MRIRQTDKQTDKHTHIVTCTDSGPSILNFDKETKRAQKGEWRTWSRSLCACVTCDRHSSALLSLAAENNNSINSRHFLGWAGIILKES